MENYIHKFCAVHWEHEDIKNAFDLAEFRPNESDILAIENICKDRGALESVMVEAGWHFIYSAIDCYLKDRGLNHD